MEGTVAEKHSRKSEGAAKATLGRPRARPGKLSGAQARRVQSNGSKQPWGGFLGNWVHWALQQQEPGQAVSHSSGDVAIRLSLLVAFQH